MLGLFGHTHKWDYTTYGVVLLMDCHCGTRSWSTLTGRLDNPFEVEVPVVESLPPEDDQDRGGHEFGDFDGCPSCVGCDECNYNCCSDCTFEHEQSSTWDEATQSGVITARCWDEVCNCGGHICWGRENSDDEQPEPIRLQPEGEVGVEPAPLAGGGGPADLGAAGGEAPGLDDPDPGRVGPGMIAYAGEVACCEHDPDRKYPCCRPPTEEKATLTTGWHDGGLPEQPEPEPTRRFMMTPGEPTLTEMERRRSKGVAVVFYADGDYRCKWFAESFFTNDPALAESITAENVMNTFVPNFRNVAEAMRQDVGEPLHKLYEVYWAGEMIWQDVAPTYTPIPRGE